MIELPPMDPCPRGKRGRHTLAVVFSSDAASDADQDLTLYCERCGAIRRLPMVGAPVSELDGLTADDVLRRLE